MNVRKELTIKKIISLLMIICIIINILIFSVHAENISILENDSVKIIKEASSEISLESDFDVGTILVTLDEETSKNIDKVYTPDDFGVENCESVRSLFNLSDKEKQYAKQVWEAQKTANKERTVFNIESIENNTLLNAQGFNQILEITLKEKTKEKVIEAVRSFEKLDGIKSAEPNYFTKPFSTFPDDPSLSLQWAINNISLPQTWDITTGSSNVTVGVIDSGIEASHQDLNDNVSTTLGENVTSDGTSFNIDSMPNNHAHGTCVAGIIGAEGNNDYCVSGVCWDITLVSIKIWGSNGSGRVNGSLCDAIDYCIEKEIDIINYSGGGSQYSDAEKEAIENYGGLFVASAGNECRNIDNIPIYPAAYDSKNIISVGASNRDNTRIDIGVWNEYEGSNFGKTSVDLFAPGVTNMTTYTNDRINYFAGTSAAAPFVTGVAALIKSIPNNNFTTEDIKRFITQNVDSIPSLADYCVTGGRLNAYKAVKAAVNSMNGKYYQVTDNNEVYVLAGGAPLYVTSWNNVGGPKATTPISRAELNEFLQYPIDDTHVRGINGTVYIYAGGAPIAVTSLNNVPAYASSIVVDETVLNGNANYGYGHTRQYPKDGTGVVGIDGTVYVFAGGAPILATAMTNIEQGISLTHVDKTVLNGAYNYGNGHVRQYPLDGTGVKNRYYNKYIFAGGAPIKVASADNLSSEPSYTIVDETVLNGAQNYGNNHVRQYPEDGTGVISKNGKIYIFAGGAPIPANTMSSIQDGITFTCVDETVLNSPETLSNGHVRQYPEDNTRVVCKSNAVYIFAGGAPIAVKSMSNIPAGAGITYIDEAVLKNSEQYGYGHVRQYPIDGTRVNCISDAVYIFAGGAPIRVYSLNNVPEGSCTATLDESVLNGELNYGYGHIREFPLDGTIVKTMSNTVFEFNGNKVDTIYPTHRVSAFPNATSVEMQDWYTGDSLANAYNFELTSNTTNSAVVKLIATDKQQVFKFVAENSGQYQIYSSNYCGNLYGELYDSAGTLISSDDDSGDELHFNITQNLTASQTYYVVVKNSTATTPTTGEFALNILVS